jgi:cardiolipin synthase
MAMPALIATHTKMIIVDGRRAWLGGMNIGREYRCDWHDMMIEVTGPLVGWMQRSFARAWARHGWTGDLGELIAQFRTSRKASAGIPVPAGAIPVRPLRGSALHSDIKDSQFAALRHARQSIWIQNAYITDSHGDTFLSNVFTILAEARSKTVVIRPDALVECSVSATAGTAGAQSAKK